MLVIRRAVSSDAEVIADLSRQTFLDTFAVSNSKENMDKFMNEQFSRHTLISEVSDPGSVFFLAQDGSEVVGYARLRLSANLPEIKDQRSIEIARLYAAHSSIGKGVGKGLMEHCLQFARQENFEVIWLGVWEHNERAINFYTKFGFHKFSQHPFVLGDDVQTDWLMMRKL